MGYTDITTLVHLSSSFKERVENPTKNRNVSKDKNEPMSYADVTKKGLRKVPLDGHFSSDDSNEKKPSKGVSKT